MVEISGYNGKYLISEDGKVFNTISNKYLIPKVYGRMKKYGYRLYINKTGSVKSVDTLLRESFGAHKDGFVDIKGFEGRYGISKGGIVWSYINNNEVKQVTTPNSNYLYVKLWKNNKEHQFTLHRLLAKTFISNPNDLPMVDHIDRNIRNNSLSNLRWVTARENLLNSEEGFVRNFVECQLYVNGVKEESFKSVSEAARYASSKFGASISGLKRNYKSKCCEIKVERLSSQEE